MEIARKKFQGVLNILSFNRHFYFLGLLLFLVLIISYLILSMNQVLFWALFAALSYGLLMPLIISAYVYDFSGYYEMNWLGKLGIQPNSIQNMININAGFDETSYLLEVQYPNAQLDVFDFYNPKQHTEAAIIRARRVSQPYPNTKSIQSDNIPMNSGTIDLVFLLSAAHEIRSHKEKIKFLSECHRVCKVKGKVIIVEHLRDLPNFLAFSIGFTHFFSKNTWLDSLEKAGFTHIEEKKFTPFMSIFIANPKV